MMDKTNLPNNYIPYEELNVCSNTLLNGKVPIEIEGHIPFLIGKGEMPQVWLSVPDSKGMWIDIIISNKRVEIKSQFFKQFFISIEESAEDKRIVISMWKTNILTVIQETENKSVITNLDLRPFNLLIYGDNEGLNIGSQLLRGNIMNNVDTMIGIGQ